MRSLTLLSLRNPRKQIRNLSLNRDQVQAEAENPLGPDLVSLEGFGLFHFLFMANKFDSHTLQIAIMCIEITIIKIRYEVVLHCCKKGQLLRRVISPILDIYGLTFISKFMKVKIVKECFNRFQISKLPVAA